LWSGGSTFTTIRSWQVFLGLGILSWDNLALQATFRRWAVPKVAIYLLRDVLHNHFTPKPKLLGWWTSNVYQANLAL